MTYTEIGEEGNVPHDIGPRKFGSHIGMMEALGMMDEYLELIEKRAGSYRDNNKLHKIREGVKMHEKDRESMINVIEKRLGEPYDKVETKYTVD